MFRLATLSAVFAAAATGVTYLANTQGLPGALRWLETILYRIELPAAFVGIAIGRNVHQPDTVTTYVALFATYFLIAIGLAALVGWIRRR